TDDALSPSGFLWPVDAKGEPLIAISYMFFFFNDAANTNIYTLSLHDALPISRPATRGRFRRPSSASPVAYSRRRAQSARSEEHTSELQSRQYLVCRLLLE